MKMITEHKSSPLNEPVDAKRNQRHATFVSTEFLRDRLNPQAYRPEILEALSVMRSRFKLVRLSEFCSSPIRQGSTPEYGSGVTPCIKVRDIEPVLANRHPEATVTLAFEKSNKKSIIGPDTILINRSGEGSVGRVSVYLSQKPAFVSDDVFACQIGNENDSAFIAAYLNSWWGKRSIEIGVVGSTGQLKLSQSHVRNLPVPDVAKDIAKSIGNKVRKADRLRELADAALTEAKLTLTDNISWTSASHRDRSKANWTSRDDLRTVRLDGKYYQPVFIEARHLINKMTGTKSLGVLAKTVSNGVEIRDFVPVGTPYLVVGNIAQGDLKIDRAPRIARNSNVPTKARLIPRDLLVVRTGSVGQAAEVLEEDCVDSTVISSHFIRIQLKDPSRSSFISAFLNSELGQLLQDQISYGAVQPQIGQEELGDLPIPSLGQKAEQKIGDCYTSWRRFNSQAASLIVAAKSDVEALISDTIDLDALQTESTAIESWLAANPSPAAKRK